MIFVIENEEVINEIKDKEGVKSYDKVGRVIDNNKGDINAVKKELRQPALESAELPDFKPTEIQAYSL